MPGFPDYLTFSHLINEAVLCAGWTRPLTQAELERGAEVVRAAAVRYNTYCWLVDARAYPLTIEQYGWLYYHFMPTLVPHFAAPVRIATLMPAEQIAELYSSSFLNASEPVQELPFRFHLFEEQEQAMEWLLRPSYA